MTLKQYLNSLGDAEAVRNIPAHIFMLSAGARAPETMIFIKALKELIDETNQFRIHENINFNANRLNGITMRIDLYCLHIQLNEDIEDTARNRNWGDYKNFLMHFIRYYPTYEPVLIIDNYELILDKNLNILTRIECGDGGG